MFIYRSSVLLTTSTVRLNNKMWQAHPENLEANPIGWLFDSHAAQTHMYHDDDEVQSTFSPMLEE